MDFSKDWVTIFFDPPQGNPVYHPFMKRGFKHCFSLAKEETGWLYAESYNRGIHIGFYDDERIKKIFRVILDWDAKALQLRSTETYQLPLSPLTCATFCAKLHGLRGTTITPFRLYCALQRRGASVFLLQDFL